MEFNFGNVFAEKYKKWACSSKHYKDIICDSPNITEEILKRSACKALKFEQSSITYYCYFKFNNEDLCLRNCLSWSLVFAKPNDKGYILVCNIGETLEECCDYLYSKVKGELELL